MPGPYDDPRPIPDWELSTPLLIDGYDYDDVQRKAFLLGMEFGMVQVYLRSDDARDNGIAFTIEPENEDRMRLMCSNMKREYHIERQEEKMVLRVKPHRDDILDLSGADADEDDDDEDEEDEVVDASEADHEDDADDDDDFGFGLDDDLEELADG